MSVRPAPGIFAGLGGADPPRTARHLSLTRNPASMMDIAMASGQSSIRRFNEARLRVRMPSSPAAPRGRIETKYPKNHPAPVSAAIRLAHGLLAFLEGRAIQGLEVVARDEYRRAIQDRRAARDNLGAAAPGNALRAEIRLPKLSQLPAIIAPAAPRVRFLGADPQAIAEQLVAGRRARATRALARPGLRVPGAWDGFELAVPRRARSADYGERRMSRLPAASSCITAIPLSIHQLTTAGLTHYFSTSVTAGSEGLRRWACRRPARPPCPGLPPRLDSH